VKENEGVALLTMMPKGVEHRGFAAQVFSSMCSTPFGIIGILTRRRWQAKAREDVLNAFRHHRNSHTRIPASIRGS
jgi:hypothetical protein